jgi:hypothetical protein
MSTGSQRKLNTSAVKVLVTDPISEEGLEILRGQALLVLALDETLTLEQPP